MRYAVCCCCGLYWSRSIQRIHSVSQCISWCASMVLWADHYTVYSTVCSGADQIKHLSSASLAWIPAQRVGDAENVSIWCRHHMIIFRLVFICLSIKDANRLCIYEPNDVTSTAYHKNVNLKHHGIHCRNIIIAFHIFQLTSELQSPMKSIVKAHA